MTDPGYIAAGYLITAGAVAAYAWSIRTRTRQVARAFGTTSLTTSGTAPATSSTTGEPDREG
jgi:hypothetical protein